MRAIWYILLAVSLSGCYQKLEPNVENINKIFETKDFSINFIPINGGDVTMSFREDYMTLKKNGNTQRVTISYEHAASINAFVQNMYEKHDPKRNERPSIIIYNDTQKIKMRVPRFGDALDSLLVTLPIKN